MTARRAYYRSAFGAVLVALLALACFLAFFFVWVLTPVFVILGSCVYLLIASRRHRESPRHARLAAEADARAAELERHRT